MIDGLPVIDAIVHPHNLDMTNCVNKYAPPIIDAFVAGHRKSADGFRLRPEGIARDWPMDDVANMAFLESHADLAVTHVLTIGAFKDGLSSYDKAVEAVTRWPDRFIAYSGVDPMRRSESLDELERQVEVLGTVGVKLYPSSWQDSGVHGWAMDDPEIAFPLFQKAQDLGIRVVAIHKAVPLGPVPLDHYGVNDIDRAAMAFPDLTFEIVHGGMAFVEETAWQLARFPNVFVNLEITGALITYAPAAFQRVLADLLRYGGETALSRIVWGTGLGLHPRPMLEKFVRDFEFDADLVERFGLPRLTREAKAGIIGENYARIVGIDLTARLDAIKDDEFSRQRGDSPPLPGYSTTTAAQLLDK